MPYRLTSMWLFPLTLSFLLVAEFYDIVLFVRQCISSLRFALSVVTLLCFSNGGAQSSIIGKKASGSFTVALAILSTRFIAVSSCIGTTIDQFFL